MTEEELELKRLYEEGLSLRLIGKALKISLRQVQGRRTKLGLTPRGSPITVFASSYVNRLKPDFSFPDFKESKK